MKWKRATAGGFSADDRPDISRLRRELERWTVLSFFFTLPCRPWSIIHAHSIDGAAGRFSRLKSGTSVEELRDSRKSEIDIPADCCHRDSRDSQVSSVRLKESLSARSKRERRFLITRDVERCAPLHVETLWIYVDDRLGSFRRLFPCNYPALRRISMGKG